MVELRERWWERFRWVLFVIVTLALGAGVAWLRTSDQSRSTACRQAYLQARTAADTARVDAWVPIVNRADAVDQMSCGFLRRTSRQ